MRITVKFPHNIHITMRGCFFLLAFIFTLSTSAYAQLRLEVSAPGSVDINEAYFQVRYTINTASVSDFNPPAFNGLEVLAGPSISTRSSYSSNGSHTSHSSSTTYTFTLAPIKKGRIAIPAASVKAGGRIYKSRSLIINVNGRGSRNPNASKQRSGTSGGEELRDAGSRVSNSDLYLSATTSKKKVYEQEGVLLTYKFFERPGVGLNSVGISSKPDFKCMVSQDIPVKNITSTATRIGNRLYKSGVVQQYLVYPQQTGKLTIPGLAFDCVVVQQEKSLDLIDAFFNGGGSVGVSLKRTAPGLNIEVMPLPTPKPAGFSGGVGHFSIKGEMLNNNPETNQLLTYRITITGNGNMKLLTAPQLQLPTDFDKFTPKTTDNSKVTTGGVSGSMVFDYTFVPRNKGKYVIPSVSFIYFDPITAKYVTIKTSPISIDVRQGKASDDDLSEDIKLLNSDIRDIHSDASPKLVKVNDVIWWGGLQYWTIHILLVAIFSILCVAYRKYEASSSNTAQKISSKAGNIAIKNLKKAYPLFESAKIRAFYTELSKILSKYITDRFSLNDSEVEPESLNHILKEKGISEGLLQEYLLIMKECARAAYSPLQEKDDAVLYEKAIQAISGIEKEMRTNKKK